MTQRWTDLTFLHWAVPAAQVAPLLPPGTRPDEHDGSSWVGLVPFRMVGAGVGTGPPVPFLGTFAETNVRLYAVDDTGRRGVVFRSLDCARLAVVLGARAVFGLPYTWSSMTVEHQQGLVLYRSVRRWPGPRGASTELAIRPGAPVLAADPLTAFLTRRWGLFTRWLGRTWYVPNTHDAWPLQRASVVSAFDELLDAAGLPGFAGHFPASVLYSAGVRTQFGRPQRVR